MAKNLVVIESPNKVKKYREVLGDDYIVMATAGHFMDMPLDRIGLDISTYEPEFVYAKGKEEIARKLKKSASGAVVYCATDPDREGMAIATMIVEEIKDVAAQIFRVEIREITEKGIKEGLSKAIPFRETNPGLYRAFLGRRVADRLVGYVLSPVVSKDLKGKFSVGRVQVPATKLVVDRERDIANFKPAPFWVLSAILGRGTDFTAWHANGRFEDQDLVETAFSQASKTKISSVKDIEVSPQSRKPLAPFTTVKLQQAANARLGFSADKIMEIAQQLFEVGLITYHRTDSVRLADEAVKEIRALVRKEYGSDYLPEKAYVHKSKNSQSEAHEGIRPTHFGPLEGLPGAVAGEGLGPDHEKLYELIWRQAVASQMAASRFEVTVAKFDLGGELFVAKGRVLRFDGFLRVLREVQEEEEGKKEKKEDDDNQCLPAMKHGDPVAVRKVAFEERKTKAPARFTDGSLCEALERLGIGRPSTYASTCKIIKVRGYVEDKKGKLYGTDTGGRLLDHLVVNHCWVTNPDLTRKMEEVLDLVEEGRAAWQGFVKSVHEKMSFVLPDERKGSGEGGGPSDGQIKFARSLAEKAGVQVPEKALANGREMSAFIEKMRSGKTGKSVSVKKAVDGPKLSDKQLLIIGAHAPVALKKKVEKGDLAAGREFLNKYFSQKGGIKNG